MNITARIITKSKISHMLEIEKDGRKFELSLLGFSKFRVKDDNGNLWDSKEIDFKDRLRFSVNIFDRMINCFCFDLSILKYFMEEGSVLEQYVNIALTDIDMTENVFTIKEVPISRSNIKLRAYINHEKLNTTSICILCNPEYSTIIKKHNVTKKVAYMKMIAKNNKVVPIFERAIASMDKDFKYEVKPMTPVSVEEYMWSYLNQK